MILNTPNKWSEADNLFRKNIVLCTLNSNSQKVTHFYSHLSQENACARGAEVRLLRLQKYTLVVSHSNMLLVVKSCNINIKKILKRKQENLAANLDPHMTIPFLPHHPLWPPLRAQPVFWTARQPPVSPCSGAAAACPGSTIPPSSSQPAGADTAG